MGGPPRPDDHFFVGGEENVGWHDPHPGRHRGRYRHGPPPGWGFGGHRGMGPAFLFRGGMLAMRGGRARRGDVRGGILVLLAEAPRNGYQLMQELGERSGGMWQPSPGSMYPALQQLEDEGLIEPEPGEGKRLYRLSAAGRAHVESHRDELGTPWEVEGDGSLLELRGLVAQVAAAVMQVAMAGTPAQVAEARTALTETRKRLYRILADETDTAGA